MFITGTRQRHLPSSLFNIERDGKLMNVLFLEFFFLLLLLLSLCVCVCVCLCVCVCVCVCVCMCVCMYVVIKRAFQVAVVLPSMLIKMKMVIKVKMIYSMIFFLFFSI